MSDPKAPPVTLRPPTDAEFEVWQDLNAQSFATGIGPAHGLDPAAALELAYQEVAKLLPDGKATENHLIWMACHDGNNSTAIKLYDSLGYNVTSQQMRKEL